MGFTNAQNEEELRGRIGINTYYPKASLHIGRHTEIPEESPQGFIPPHISQEQRNKMSKTALERGLQIFNTDKNCIDWWNGKTWQCTDGSLKDEHGSNTLYTHDAEHTETKIFYKNNCPAGQQPKEGTNFTGTGVGRGISSISLQDAKDKAIEIAKQNYQVLGQDYANANGLCEPAPVVPPTNPISITDPSFQLGNTYYWFSSIYDNDYLTANGEVIKPIIPASWNDQTPVGDGIPESKVLDVQGIVPALNQQRDNAIEVVIPILTPVNADTYLPSFTTYLEIPAEYTEDHKKGVMVLTWEPTPLTTATQFFKAYLYAKDTDIKLKKLDLMKGMGSDHMGLSLGVFKYPINASDSNNNPSDWKGRFNVRLISGIPDKYFSTETTINLDTQKRHQFLYVPAMGADGKIWLGNNLGADYANLNHTAFNPGQQAKNYYDYHAYGSLAQWGRGFDGEELVIYTNSYNGTPVINPPKYWSSNSSSLQHFTENCPMGWHTPTKEEMELFRDKVNMQEDRLFAGGLRIAMSGYRSTSINFTAAAYWWSSTPVDSEEGYVISNNNLSSNVNNIDKTEGFGIRCIKN